MTAYKSTPGDVEAGAEERTVVLVERSSPCGWMWKVLGALLVVALCLGGVLLFAWYWNDRMETTAQSGHMEVVTKTDPEEKPSPHNTLRQISSKAKAAIHLEGYYGEGESSTLEWMKDQGQAFAQGDFKLKENRIIVPHTGLYFVYSQASFRVSCGKDGDDDNRAGRHFTPLSHRIWRMSDSIGSKASLMSAVRSACQNTPQEDGFTDGQGWYNAIYLGAVFHLHKGDQLWTETNQLSELDTDDGKTFFGVFAL